MPFGKYEGSEISSIPREYLSWLITSCTDRDDSRYSIGQVKYYAKKELLARDNGKPEPTAPKAKVFGLNGYGGMINGTGFFID